MTKFLRHLIFSQRSKTSKEFWLVYASNVKTLNNQVNNLNIDLDDDLYIYEQNSEKNSVQMWEVYRIHQNIPVKVLHYGNWSDENGMNLENQFKWKRRSNLEVNNYYFQILITLFWSTYFSKTLPHPKKNFFFSIQKSLVHTLELMNSRSAFCTSK